jgi:tRNA G18 (ribose-2'-O)-methylase SpoU
MGAVFKLPAVESSDLAADLAFLRDEFHVQLAATVLDEGAEVLETAARPARLALLFGNEGHGLPGELVELCQRKITVPMCRDTDSLNAAVASGVFLYHFTRVAGRSS